MSNDAFELVKETVDRGEPAGKKSYVAATGREGGDDVDNMAEGVDEGDCGVKWCWGGEKGRGEIEIVKVKPKGTLMLSCLSVKITVQ